MNTRSLLATLALAAAVSSALAQVAPKPVPPAKPPTPQPTPRPVTPTPPATRPAEPKVDFEISRSIKIGGDGKWESPTLDDMGKFLYIPRTRRMQVLDLTENKLKGEIIVGNARSVTLVSSLNRGFITSGAENQVVVFDIPTLDVLGRISVEGHPLASAYDPSSKKVLVCCAEGKCLVPIPADIDLKTGKPDKAIELAGRPTGVVTDSQGSAFVSIMDTDEIALIDTKASTVLTKWAAGAGTRPIGLAIDEAHARLLAPQKMGRLGVFSTVDGHEIQNVELRAGQIESAAFCKDRAFVLSNDGTLIIVNQNKDGRYDIQQSLKIGDGSWSMVADPKTGNVYVPAMDFEGRRPVKDSFKVLVLSPKQ